MAQGPSALGEDTGAKPVRQVGMAHARAPAWLTASGLLGPCRLPEPKRQPTYKLKNATDGNAYVRTYYARNFKHGHSVEPAQDQDAVRTLARQKLQRTCGATRTYPRSRCKTPGCPCPTIVGHRPAFAFPLTLLRTASTVLGPQGPLGSRKSKIKRHPGNPGRHAA